MKNMKKIFIVFPCLLAVQAFTPSIDLKNSQAPLKHIYLTFDDGPLEGSENVDSIILAERLKINVFLVGEHATGRLKRYYDMYEQNPFVESYNHSFTHAHNKYRLFYSNAENVLADIQKNEQALSLKYKIVRLPGRNMWRLGKRTRDDGPSGKEAADLLARNGFKLYGWDTEWEHHPTDGTPVQTVAEMTKEIESRLESGRTFTKDHIVVLVHDEMFRKDWEKSELNQLIDNLRAHDNYVFEHIRFYPEN